MMDNWIEIKPGCELPNNFEWVEVKYSSLDYPLEFFYWDKYGWSKHITHWRRITWHFNPLPVEVIQIDNDKSI